MTKGQLAMSVTQLGYIGFSVKDLEAWRTLAGPMLGFELRERVGDDAPLYLRLDENHHRVALFPAKVESIAYIGWEVADFDALERLAERIAGGGIEIHRGTEEQAETRKVHAFYALQDPEGFPVEIFCGAMLDDAPLRTDRPVSGYVCGELGLGHIVLIAKDPKGLADFYLKTLGFRLSDYIAWDDARGTFLHCNPRHHSLAILNECYGLKAGSVHHIMVQAEAMDDVGRAYDLVMKNKVPIALSLGKHSNDHMTSFYLATPSGFEIEYGWGGRLIEDEETWRVQRYKSPKLWGHNRAV